MCASITSKTLFIIVAESIEIFLPIFQLGCFKANFESTFFKSDFFLFKKGPPEAVKKTSFISLSFLFRISLHNEKCSESSGINDVLFLYKDLLIKSQPHIIDSLFATATFLLISIDNNKCSSPAMPEIPQTEISTFFFYKL